VDPALDSPAPAPWSAPSIEEVAGAAGADDLFLFRRIGPDRFAHVDGCGRGAGWAGIVEIGLGDEPRLRAALKANRLLRWESDAATHVFGPYYARSVVITPVSHDSFAVFGSQGSPVEQLSDSEFRELGGFAAESLLEASPAKRLADELEVVNAVRELLSSPALNLTERSKARRRARSARCRARPVCSTRRIPNASRSSTGAGRFRPASLPSSLR